MKMKRYIRRMGVAVVMLLLAHGSALAQSTLKNLVEHATVKWYADQQKSTELTTVTLTSSTQTLYLEITPADGWWTNADLLGGQVRLIGKNSAADARRRSGEPTGPVIGSPMAVTAVSGQTYHKYGGGLYQVQLPALASDQSADQIARLELTGQMTKCRTITPAVVNTTMTVKIDDGAVTYAKPGEKIDVTIAPAVDGYQFNHFTVTYLYGTTQQPVEVTTLSVESRSFTMPDGDVTIDASYITPRPYAVKNEAGDVLTIYFGGIATTGYDSNNSTWRTSEDSGWGEIKTTLKTVIIDPEMANCTSLTSLEYWFSGCTNLTEIQGLAYLKTGNVTDMSHLFEGCEGFTKLYLTTFDTRKVTDMTAMFKGCTNLKRIFVDTNWSAGLVTSSTDMFTGCTNIKGRKGTAYDAAHTDAGYAHVDAVDNPGYLMPNAQLYALYTSSDRTLTFYYDGETRSGVRTEGDAFKNGVKESYQDGYDKFGWGGDMKTVVFDESMADCDEITSMSWWFANYTSIQAVKGLEYLVMDNVTDIKYAFWYSTGLKEFDFSKFNTKNVKVMYNSFYRIGMPEVDFTEFDTSSVEDMRGICGWSGALKKITVGGKFDTRKFTTPANDLSEFRGVGCDIVQVKDASNHHISVNIFQEMADRTTRRLETDSPLPEGEVTQKDGYLWWKGAKFATYNGFRPLKMGTPQNGSVALSSAATYEGFGEEGQTLTITATPNPGYETVSITLTYNDGTAKTITCSDTDDNNVKTVVMPGYEATVTATFQPIMKLVDPTKACSKDNPYMIQTMEDMRNLSAWVNAGAPYTRSAFFKVMPENAVFDFEGVDDFLPIGGFNSTFNSSFDGNGVTIKNLHITNTEANKTCGLFGYADRIGAVIQNITIDKSCSFTSSGSYTGAIVGRGYRVTINNCRNLGASVTGIDCVGGIIGQAYGSSGYPATVSNCVSESSVTGNKHVGGIIGNIGNYFTLKGNTVGLLAGKDAVISISGTAYVGAVSGGGGSSTQSDNFYNGMVVVRKIGETESKGFGYGAGSYNEDGNGIESATGGYCGKRTENGGKNVEWQYDLYTKEMRIFGSGTTDDFTVSLAPNIIQNRIETLIIDKEVTGIGQKAFNDWTSLHTVIFEGCELTTAADNAFEGCTAMAEGKVIVKNHSPLVTGTANALFTVISNGTLLSDEFVDLTEELTETDGKYLWHGGTFASYEHYRRTLEGITFSEDHHWTTYYAAEDLVTPEGLTAYVVDEFNGEAITITAIAYIPKGVGVLLYSEEAGGNYTTDAYTGDKALYTSLLKGSLKELSLTDGGGYILYHDEFVKVTDGVIPAKRCYLPVADGNVAPARLRITNSGSTGVREVESYDNENGTWYDLNGRKLDGTPKRKGIYIRNGRKTVVK